MKKILIFTFLLFTSSPSFAGIDLNKLLGSWTMGCTQTQNSANKQGSLIETYVFKLNGNYQLSRQCYQDVNCKENSETETQSGNIVIGKLNTNNGFNPEGTYETEYKHDGIVELGLLWVDGNYSKLRVGKGFGKTQNTMLSLFEYKKQP